MERLQIQAQPRAISTKGQLKELRKAGLVPGVVYGQKEEPIAIAVDAKDINAILNSPTGTNTLVDLSLDGEPATVIMKELTRDILVSDRYLHVDFLRISLTERLELQIPIVLVGDAAGVKEGGILQQSLREVTLKCLPTNIPEQIELDVSELQMGESLTVADLIMPEDTEVVSELDEVVVTVVAPRAEEPEEEEEAGEGIEEEEVAAEETEAAEKDEAAEE
ncbi:MAG: 50S ribosomal protein L25/general stress protein Ctc [Firmicutes bacterium]|nr:50S ribosomal protein L25/general stress protein Ctc [Bacillota bacterium]